MICLVNIVQIDKARAYFRMLNAKKNDIMFTRIHSIVLENHEHNLFLIRLTTCTQTYTTYQQGIELLQNHKIFEIDTQQLLLKHFMMFIYKQITIVLRYLLITTI